MKTPSRSGKTLIELVLVIVVLGMVMTISAKTMVVVLNRERSGSDAFLANSDRARLASDLRRDVNAAQSAGVTDAGDNVGGQLDLTLVADRAISYGVESDVVTRLVKQGEEIVGREQYRIGHNQARFEIDSGDREQVSLVATITHRPEKSSVPQRRFQIDAVTAKDLRFQVVEGTP